MEFKHNGLIYFDNPLEVGGQVVYFVKITPYGGILEIGTHARNFIVDGIYDLVLIYKQNYAC